MPNHSMICAVLLLGGIAQTADCQPNPADSTRAWRESLRAADANASAAAFNRGLAAALPSVMTDDAVLLWEAAPIISGRAGIQQLLAAQPSVRVSWQPFRVLVSTDGKFGVTFGATSRYSESGAPASVARYMSAWRRDSPGGWRMAAHAQVGLVSPDSVKIPSPLQGALGLSASLTASLGEALARSPGITLQDKFAAADIAFARMAADSSAPAAFYHFSAPDAMTFAGTGELNIGPPAIRARLAEGAGGKAKWVWRPVITIAAPSGDLGITIGTAEIDFGAKPSDPFLSKYLTVWQRQPDGSMKFVADGGSGRPKTP